LRNSINIVDPQAKYIIAIAHLASSPERELGFQRFITPREKTTMTVKAAPEGWHSITPRLVVADAAQLVRFLTHAFGASGSFRNDGPSEIHIGDSIVMVSEAGVRDAMPAFLYLYLEDTDIAYQRAVEAGATVIEEPQDMFYGDRRATVRDPFGNIWQIATHKEDLTLEEIRRRAVDGSRR
jgi:PhnB protein